MPKQQKEINAFNSGIILNADERDIGIDTPAFSLNINPLAKQGILSGIKASRFITSIDASSTRVLFPNIYGESGSNLNDVTVPKIDTDIVCIEDIRNFENSGNYISYIGTQGYKETLTNQYSCPHMERLIITQTHLGNDSTTTYGVFTGTAITLEQATFSTAASGSTANLADSLSAGDYIQLSTATSFKEPNAYEIMEVLSIDRNSVIATITITDFSELNNGDKVNLIAKDSNNYDFVCGDQSSVNGTWAATTSNDATATNLMNVINTSSGPSGTRFNATVIGAVVTVTQAVSGDAGITNITLTDSGTAGMSKTDFIGANTITVKRGVFKSVKQIYASGTTYMYLRIE